MVLFPADGFIGVRHLLEGDFIFLEEPDGDAAGVPALVTAASVLAADVVFRELKAGVEFLVAPGEGPEQSKLTSCSPAAAQRTKHAAEAKQENTGGFGNRTDGDGCAARVFIGPVNDGARAAGIGEVHPHPTEIRASGAVIDKFETEVTFST